MILEVPGEEGRAEGPRGIHAAAGVGHEAEAEHGDGQAELDGRGVGVAGVARVRDGTRHEDEDASGEHLSEEALREGDVRVKQGHAKAALGGGIAAVKKISGGYDLKWEKKNTRVLVYFILFFRFLINNASLQNKLNN